MGTGREPHSEPAAFLQTCPRVSEVQELGGMGSAPPPGPEFLSHRGLFPYSWVEMGVGLLGPLLPSPIHPFPGFVSRHLAGG